jgi:outer membrane immunogenic protein
MAPRLAFNNPATFNSSGFRGGSYGGYNWQFGVGVIGIEGDWAWGRNSKTLAGIPGAENPAVAGSPGLDTSTVKETWDAGIRGRLGFLVSPTVLIYGTGGWSWTSVQASAFCGTAFATGWCSGGTPGFVGTTSTISTTLSGWTAGGGLEWMAAPNWLLRGEYRYTSYGSISGTFFPGVNGGGVLGGDAIAANVKLHTNTAIFGVAYKFGGGPVVAGY